MKIHLEFHTSKSNGFILSAQTLRKSDYYQVLGIEKNSSTKDIKKAYYRLAKKYHPDQMGGDKKKFQDLFEAYEVLGDENKRQKYDTFGKTVHPYTYAQSSSPPNYNSSNRDKNSESGQMKNSFHSRETMRLFSVSLRLIFITVLLILSIYKRKSEYGTYFKNRKF